MYLSAWDEHCQSTERLESRLTSGASRRETGLVESPVSIKNATEVGFLSPISTEDTKEKSTETVPRLDPYVAKVLAEEPIATQRTVIGILTILKGNHQGEGVSTDEMLKQVVEAL